MHVSSLNPQNWCNTKYSSLQCFLHWRPATFWLKCEESPLPKDCFLLHLSLLPVVSVSTGLRFSLQNRARFLRKQKKKGQEGTKHTAQVLFTKRSHLKSSPNAKIKIFYVNHLWISTPAPLNCFLQPSKSVAPVQAPYPIESHTHTQYYTHVYNTTTRNMMMTTTMMMMARFWIWAKTLLSELGLCHLTQCNNNFI
jgi:hypothetical protein